MEQAAIRWDIPLHQSILAIQGKGSLAASPLVVALPHAWMNQSGVVAGALLTELGLAPDNLVVVHDDLDLNFGVLRIKSHGGAGGHNGLHSLLVSLETDRFSRVKIGIGRPPEGEDPAQYVLSPFHSEEISNIHSVLSLAVDALEALILEGPPAAMNRFNMRSNEEKESC